MTWTSSWTRAPIATVSLAAFAAHARALAGGWVLDDAAVLRDGHEVRTLPGMFALLTRPVTRPEGEPGASPVYRPLTSFVDWLSWQLARAHEPTQHATVIALHVLASVIVLKILARRVPARVATAAALLFAVHPATTPVVATLGGRAIALGVVLVLGGLHAISEAEDPRRLFVTSALATAGALACHESFVLAPAVFVAASLASPARGAWRAVLAGGVLGAIAFALLPAFRDAGLATGIAPASALARTAATLVLRGSRAAFMPPDVVLGYSVDTSLPGLVVVLALVAACASAAPAVLLARRGSPATPIAAAGAAIALGIALGSVPAAARGGVGADLFAYVFALGTTLALGALAGEASALVAAPRVLGALPPIAALALALVSWSRSATLRDDATLLAATARASPDDPEGRLAGALLAMPADVRSAHETCASYAASHPVGTRAHGCVAAALVASGRASDALPWARAYAGDRPNTPRARRLLFDVLLASDRLDEARALLDAWAARSPRSRELASAREAFARRAPPSPSSSPSLSPSPEAP